ncbi:MAG TPA: NUDIX domain-containing protein [Verrucomicrobiae bacterium]|jgi:ADP-ribose pyrophosphatase YjhB (NUDIX family)|nr:NUDIX domain-containing protein [Verrucomicrobiae bacterium]
MRQSVRAIVLKDDALLVMRRDKFGQEFYALVGGGVDVGETLEQALHREIKEETGLTVSNPRLVIIEDAGKFFGMQHIYVCDYVSGEPALAPDSEEAKITALGQNLYQPLWLPLQDLPHTELRPAELKQALLGMLPDKFPEQPLQLTIPD